MKTFREFIEEVHIYEMRKEDKVKGKKKTPLYTFKTVGKVERAPEESGKKWERKNIEIKNISAKAGMGRYRQGGSGGSELAYKRHPHGGADDWTPAGSQRGVKKVPGEKKPEVGHISPADRVAARRANLKYLSRR